MIHFLFSVLLIPSTFNLYSIHAFHFVCPQYVITVDDGPIGVIPRGRVGLSVIPAHFNCEFHFSIPSGWALHLSISTHYDQLLGDEISFTDNLGEIHVLPTPNQHIDEWAGAPSAVLHIETRSNQSQMFAIYEFVNIVKKYRHVMVQTGEYFSLGNMEKQYFTFYSKSKDQISLNLAVKNAQDYDKFIDFIFVYDGGDIKSSKMISRLSTFLKKHKVSSSYNLTIVNFWNVLSSSYLIGNDFSKIKMFSKYKAILTSKNQQTTGELFDASDQGAAYTWICTDCKHFYWTSLKFHKSKTTYSKAFIELKSLSPTHSMPTLLNYSANSSLDNYFPQLIPSRMFTMINHYSGIGVILDTSTSKSTTQTWLKPFDNRKGTIFSPSLWDPMTSPAFSFCFEDINKKFMFGVNVKNVRVSGHGESLTIKTGPITSENSSFHEFFSERTDFWTRREAQGNYMHISYDGRDRRSMAIISFDMMEMKCSTVPRVIPLVFIIYSFVFS